MQEAPFKNHISSREQIVFVGLQDNLLSGFYHKVRNETLVDQGVNIEAEGKDVTLPNIQFFLRGDLLCYRDGLDGRERLYVPKAMEQIYSSSRSLIE